MTELTDIDVEARDWERGECSPPEALADQDHDDRFRKLMSPADWATLPVTVRRRFSVALRLTGRRVFAGRVVSVAHSRAGHALAHLARLFGGPLPHASDASGLSTVVVTPDDRLGGQIWTRTYARAGRMPQTINSVKRFHGPTGLEEYLGAGLVMALTLHTEDGALVFRSAGFAYEFAGRRISIPTPLSPGRCTIVHRDLGAGQFSFSLSLDHPWLGRLVHQLAVYEEITP